MPDIAAGSAAEILYERPAPRQQAGYRCERGHVFEVTFAASAEPPAAWECRCGAIAGQPGVAVAVESEFQRRMGQLLERRTVAELEELLAERLAQLAASRTLES